MAVAVATLKTTKNVSQKAFPVKNYNAWMKMIRCRKHSVVQRKSLFIFLSLFDAALL